MNIKKAISRVVEGQDLSVRQMSSVFSDIMEGKATPAQIAAFLTALRIKGETIDEITSAALIMRRKALKLDLSPSLRSGLVDTCGTGGSGKNTFNFSTASAFIVAGCGVKVAKHGNRSASGKCGSADVLQELGVNLEMSPRHVERSIEEIGIGFIFAPLFHGSVKYAVTPRKETGIRTIFNVLGPLCNPAFPARQVMAVYDGKLTEKIAAVLGKLGAKKACVVHGSDGIDEVTVTGKTRVSELDKGKVRTYNLDPSDLGLKRYSPKSIAGGDPKVNAGKMKALFAGKKGALRDMAVMNAALALKVADKASDLIQAALMAEKSIDSGKAAEKLELVIKASNRRR